MTFAQLQKEWIRGDRNVVAQDLAPQTHDNLFRFVRWLSRRDRHWSDHVEVTMLAKLMDANREKK
jgi:hypothetical protein